MKTKEQGRKLKSDKFQVWILPPGKTFPVFKVMKQDFKGEAFRPLSPTGGEMKWKSWKDKTIDMKALALAIGEMILENSDVVVQWNNWKDTQLDGKK